MGDMNRRKFIKCAALGTFGVSTLGAMLKKYAGPSVNGIANSACPPYNYGEVVIPGILQCQDFPGFIFQ